MSVRRFAVSKIFVAGTCVFLGGATAPFAYGVPPEYEASFRTEYSDNVGKDSDNEDSDTALIAEVTVRFEEQLGRLFTSLDGTIGGEHYIDDTFDDELLLDIEFLNDLELIPSALNWVLDNTVKVVLENTEDQDTADNRQLRNIFETGPRYTLPVTRVDTLIFSGLYRRTDYDETDTDSEGYLGRAGWNHRFSESASAELSHVYERVEFDDGVDLDENTTELGLVMGTGRSEFSGSVGYTDVSEDGSNGDVDEDEIIWALGYAYQIDDNSDFGVSLGHELTDVSQSFDDFTDNVDVNFDDTEVVTITEVAAKYNRRLVDGGGVSAGLFWDEQEYEGSDRKETNMGFELTGDYPLSSTLTSFAGVKFTNSEFDDGDNLVRDREDDTWETEVGMEYHWLRKVYLNADLGFETSDSNVSEEDYDEFTVAVGIRAEF